MRNQSLRDKIAAKCVHFNGLQNKTCQADMVYDDVDKENRIPYRKGLPCVKRTVVEQCKCPHLRFPTEAELQGGLEAREATMRKMAAALEAVKTVREKHRGQDWQGTIECPNCKKALHVSHAGINGHVIARCETTGCVAWME